MPECMSLEVNEFCGLLVYTLFAFDTLAVRISFVLSPGFMCGCVKIKRMDRSFSGSPFGDARYQIGFAFPGEGMTVAEDCFVLFLFLLLLLLCRIGI